METELIKLLAIGALGFAFGVFFTYKTFKAIDQTAIDKAVEEAEAEAKAKVKALEAKLAEAVTTDKERLESWFENLLHIHKTTVANAPAPVIPTVPAPFVAPYVPPFPGVGDPFTPPVVVTSTSTTGPTS